MPIEQLPRRSSIDQSSNEPSEAEKLQEDLRKKTLFETVISEFQTRDAPIRGYQEKTRGEVFRFERGQIYKAYRILREQIRDATKKGEDATEKKTLLKEMRRKAKFLEENLDELNRQYYENVRIVEIETRHGKFSVPVVELDLRKNEEGEPQEKDERVPYFLLGGVATNYHQTAALSMGLALEGERVLVPAWPEQAMVGRPDNFGELLKQQKGLEFHTDYARQIMAAVGLGKVNIIGYSMGGAVALELAQDQTFQEMQDLVVVEPTGLEEKSLVGISKDFMIEEGLLKTFPFSEARIKTFLQGEREDTSSLRFLIEDGRILAQRSFDTEKLGKINPKGRYQVWVGTKSSIADARTVERLFLEAEKLRKRYNPDASPVEIYIVEGGTHGWPCMSSLGFSELLTEEEPREQTTVVNFSELTNSGIEGILKKHDVS